MVEEPQSNATVVGLSPARLENLCDGVFSIVMTLLVFGIKVPKLPKERVTAELLPRLLEQWPSFASCALSFAVIAIYWIGHHNQFHYIRVSDRILVWINILFLLFLAFIPFSAALLGEYPLEHVAVVVHGGNLVVVGLLSWLHWAYVTHGRRLVAADLSEALVLAMTRRILLAPIAHFLAVTFAFLSPFLSLAIFLAVPVLYVLPARSDRHLDAAPRQGSAPEGKGG